MANEKSTKKDTKKTGGKAPFFKRVQGLFKNIRTELKKVIWPDRKRWKQNVAAVLVILLSTALIIFVFDNVVHFFLNSVGFYHHKSADAPVPAVTVATPVEQPTETTAAETTEAPEATESKSGN